MSLGQQESFRDKCQKIWDRQKKSLSSSNAGVAAAAAAALAATSGASAGAQAEDVSVRAEES